MSEFHFLRPWFLLLIPVAIVCLFWWLQNKSKKDGWQQSCDPHLLKAMQSGSNSAGSRWRLLYWPIALITIVALAGPAFRELPSPVVKNQSALVIALDLSKSMLADDLKPSRLQRARYKIKDLLAARADGQTALIAYAGEAFVVTPLTDDTQTINELLDSLDPEIMPVGGSDAATALTKAAELLQQASINRGEVLLVTDGVKLQSVEQAAAKIAADGYHTSVLAVATAEGSPIPIKQGFLKDRAGTIVVPKLDAASLIAVANAGEGQYFDVNMSDAAWQSAFSTQTDDTEEAPEQDAEFKRYIDEGPWLFLLLLPLTALLYRRGLLMVIFLLPMMPQESLAFEWQDLWLNKDQRAWQALQNTETEKASRLAQDPAIKATAAYKEGAFNESAGLFASLPEDSLLKHYNQGNALAHAGQLEDALSSYDAALKIDPEDADTLYNKSIVEQALQQKEEQQQQQGDESEQQDEDQQQDSQQSSEDQQQEEESGQQSSEDQQQGENSEEMTEEQKQQEREQQQQQAQADESDEPSKEEQQQQAEMEESESTEEGEEQEITLTPEEQALDAEEQQAMEQWLRRIKDDPGGLLRRKFLYQYYRQNKNNTTQEEDW